MAADYYDLGDYSRTVTTSSVRAQVWFDRGLNWAYAFNFEEAQSCFERAVNHDPCCAMAHWGIAFALGPNYNKGWRLFDAGDFVQSSEMARAALARAQALADRITPVERALIEALPRRFAAEFLPPMERQPLNTAYADAMREVYGAFPEDLDVASLFADALLCVSPRQLWDLPTGEPKVPGTLEADGVLTRAMATPEGEKHPALNHLYIHLMEMSPRPELAIPQADRVRRMMPGASHMAHMASHIDNAVGNYRGCIDANEIAAAANDVYLDRAEGVRFYHIYRAHDLYVQTYGAMMIGRFHQAWKSACRLRDALPEHILRVTSPPMADWAESHVSAYVHVLIRFGKWEEVLELDLPEDRDLYCVTVAMICYARGVALSALGRIEEAEAAKVEFYAALAKVPDSRMSLPNKEVDVLKVAAAMLEGEFAYRVGDYDVAYGHLRNAIELEDALQYADPRSWLQPVRHAYGALLLEQGHVVEAEAVYRADLGFDGSLPRAKVHPNNVWSLHGLYECLVRLGRDDQAAMIRMQRDIAVASADIPIAASCYCRRSAYAAGEPEAGAGESCCATAD